MGQLRAVTPAHLSRLLAGRTDSGWLLWLGWSDRKGYGRTRPLAHTGLRPLVDEAPFSVCGDSGAGSCS